MAMRSRSGAGTPDHDPRRIAISESIRNGLWFIPGLMVLGSWALAIGLTAYDQADHWFPFRFHGDASSAQDMLSTIASATLAMTTLVVSITMVALQLASQQFSPRVMRTFFRDRGTKVALGIFLGTTVYALLVLRKVVPEDGATAEFVPEISVTVGFGLMLCSLFAFLYYLHHVAHSIRAVHIMEAVAAETRAAIRTMPTDEEALAPGEWPDRAPDQLVASEQPPGSVVSVDEDDLVALAVRHRAQIRLVPHVGDYLPSRSPLAEVWYDDPARASTLAADDLVPLIGLGRERTMRQDVAFGFRQLVDMASKALSPGINDPTTAVQVVDRIHDLLRRIAAGPPPRGVHRDEEGTARLVAPLPTWDDFVHLACDEIRVFGAGSLQVHQRLRGMLADLELACADRPDRLRVLQVERDLLDRAAQRAFDDPEDRRAAGLSSTGTRVDR
ncbi:MAG: DUF2254 domain-containing protein [Acidimicrobiales bacterium]|nr:DUF2254 domain-containing protein [Acidimicrobiales bacterium]